MNMVSGSEEERKKERERRKERKTKPGRRGEKRKEKKKTVDGTVGLMKNQTVSGPCELYQKSLDFDPWKIGNHICA